MSTLLVTDTSALIALHRVGLTPLLPALYEPVLAPPAVIREFGQPLSWVRQRAPSNPERVSALRQSLDAGEAEAIAVAEETPHATLLIDEARGRRVAVRLGLRIIGTAGVLLGARRAGLVPHVKPTLDELRDRHAFRLSDDLYDWVVREAGEG